MSDQQKLVVVLLVMVALLFAVAVIYGLVAVPESGGFPGARDRPAWTERIKSLLVSEQRLRSRDTSADCREEGVWVIPRGATCRIEVAEARAAVRVAKLRLAQGQMLGVVLDQPGSVRETRTLTTGASRDFDVFSDGGSFDLACSGAGGPACRVELVR